MRLHVSDSRWKLTTVIVWLLFACCFKAFSQQLVITDQNAAQIIAQGARAGHGTGFIQGKTKLKLKFTDQYPVIPRDQWPHLVKDGQGTFLSDLIKAVKIPAKDQDGLGYCWVYASTELVEVERAVQNQGYVSLSPESVGGPLTGWRNQGGDGIDALNQLTSAGCCANSFMDKANSLSSSRWKTGWQQDASSHTIVVSWASVDNFDEVFSALLYRMPVSIGLNWWGHQVMLTDPVILPNGGYGVVFRNSWGEDWPSQGASGWSTLTESKSQPSGSFACVGVNTAEIKPGEKSTPLSLIKARSSMIKKRIEETKGVPKACGPVR